ncbi:MAG: hypothetical protein HYT30_01210 [Parcubacteria group bacterium]|nr:hypothetical protein [Parcubacteria group bacterium]
MLSMFPELLFLTPLSALIIRAAAAVVFALAAYIHARGIRSPLAYIMALLECACALSLMLGSYAQLGALLGVLLTLAWLILGRPARPFPLSTTLLLLVMSFSVMITGPGAFAFDLPL